MTGTGCVVGLAQPLLGVVRVRANLVFAAILLQIFDDTQIVDSSVIVQHFSTFLALREIFFELVFRGVISSRCLYCVVTITYSTMYDTNRTRCFFTRRRMFSFQIRIMNRASANESREREARVLFFSVFQEEQSLSITDRIRELV